MMFIINISSYREKYIYFLKLTYGHKKIAIKIGIFDIFLLQNGQINELFISLPIEVFL